MASLEQTLLALAGNAPLAKLGDLDMNDKLVVIVDGKIRIVTLRVLSQFIQRYLVVQPTDPPTTPEGHVYT